MIICSVIIVHVYILAVILTQPHILTTNALTTIFRILIVTTKKYFLLCFV